MLKHAYKSLKSDPVDATLVGASKWNADHYFLDAAGNPTIGALGDLAYCGAAGLVSLLAGAAGVLQSAGSGSLPAYTMNPTLTSLTVTGAITAGSVIITGGSGSISGAELAVLDGVVPGTVTASKAVVVDANKDIASFRNVTLSGALFAGIGTAADPSVQFSTATGLYSSTAGATSLFLSVNNANVAQWTASEFRILSDSAAIAFGALQDVTLSRPSANLLALATGDSFQIVSGSLLMGGHITFPTDNTYDLGANGATRPRSLYLGTSINIAGLIVASAAGISINGAGATGVTFDRAGVTYGTISTGSNHLTFTASNGATFDFNGGDVKVQSAITVGTNPSTTGAIRIANNQFLNARNAANTADINLIGLMSTNAVLIGNGATDVNISGGILSLGGTAAQTGAIRLGNNQGIYARNVAATGDAHLISLNTIAPGQILVGATGYHTIVNGYQLRLHSEGMASAASPVNGDWWVDCTGTSPARICALRVFDGGAIRTLASFTY